jgi:N-acetylneuraminate synthase
MAVNYVAELSANHNQSIDRAIEIIREMSKAGATSIKLQTYKPETMTLNLRTGDFSVSESNPLWGGRSLFDLYAEAHTPWEWHAELFREVRSLGMIPFSSPFDAQAVDLLEELGCEIYKIASFEVVDTELISYAASTGKPLIISTGMASVEEIAQAVDAARSSGCSDITLLKTTSSYPADPRFSNLVTMPRLGELFGVKYGVSDHTMGIGVAVAAVTLGATVVEKHVTLSRGDGGVDSAFSMEPAEFGELVIQAERAREALGEIHFGPSPGDESSLAFRRTLYVSDFAKAGDEVTRANVRAIRPGGGLPVRFLKDVVGLRFTKDVQPGTPMSFDLLK